MEVQEMDLEKMIETLQKQQQKKELEQLEARAGWNEWMDLEAFHDFTMDAYVIAMGMRGMRKTFNLEEDRIFGVPLKDLYEHFRKISQIFFSIQEASQKARDRARDDFLDMYDQRAEETESLDSEEETCKDIEI